jgi:integrase
MTANAAKKRYHTNRGLVKRCGCRRSAWETCPHVWFFAYMWKGTSYRGSLAVADRADAIAKFASVKAAIMNATYTKPTTTAVETPARSERPTFAMVAAQYERDPEGLAKLSAGSRKRHTYDLAFLAMVTVPPDMPFTEKPFADIIRADIKLALGAKATPTARTYKKKGSEKAFTRTVGGKVAANRLHNRLQSLWNWAIEEQYATSSPFIRTRKGKNRLKHDECGRDRRLRDGEEAALLEHANGHLTDCLVAALETGMRKGEILSLQWSQVRWLQNELYLPGAKTKNKRDRKIPISPTLREVLTRRQHGMTEGPQPQPFKFGEQHFVFGNEAGNQVKDIKTAWENTVLKAHGVKPQRTGTAGLSATCQAKLDEIDLHFHDLRHEAGSRKLETGWPLHAVSAWLGHANVTTTARYLNVKSDYLHELNERAPLVLVK